jgi:hypothetical protein
MSIAEPVGSTEIDSGAFRQSDNTDVEKAAESLDTSLRRVSEASTIFAALIRDGLARRRFRANRNPRNEEDKKSQAKF